MFNTTLASLSTALKCEKEDLATWVARKEIVLPEQRPRTLADQAAAERAARLEGNLSADHVEIEGERFEALIRAHEAAKKNASASEEFSVAV